MTTKTCRTVLLLSSLMIWNTTALAKGDLLPGKLGDYGRHYDVDTEETFTARVLRVHEVCYSGSSRMVTALEVVALGDKESGVVYVGPKERLERAGFPVRAGADVCIVASRASVAGKTIWISKSIRSEGAQYVLRSSNGRHFNLDVRTGIAGGDSICTIAAAGGG